MVRLFIVILALLLMCFPSSANVVRPLASHPGADDLAAACGKAVTWQQGGGYACTKENCDGKGGHCTISCSDEGDCMGSTPSRNALVGTFFGGFDNTLAPPEPFALKHVSVAKLLGACRSVPGALFGKDEGSYFCANPKCDPGIGPCYVDCDLSKCVGAMAKKLGPTITLLAILQNGDPVSRIVTPPEKNSPSKDSSSEEPEPPPILIP